MYSCIPLPTSLPHMSRRYNHIRHSTRALYRATVCPIEIDSAWTFVTLDFVRVSCPLRSEVEHFKDNAALPLFVGLAEQCLMYR